MPSYPLPEWQIVGNSGISPTFARVAICCGSRSHTSGGKPLKQILGQRVDDLFGKIVDSLG